MNEINGSDIADRTVLPMNRKRQEPITREVRAVSLLCPFLLAVCPIAFLGGHNAGEVSFALLVAPIGVALAATALVLSVCLRFVRNPCKAAAVTSLVVLSFFTYGHAFALIWALRFFTETLHVHLFLLSIVSCTLVIGTGVIVRRGNGFGRHAPTIAAFTTVMLVWSGVQLFEGAAENVDELDARHQETRFLLEESADAPDIYYFVLDGYARGDILDEVYGFDNSDFLDYLKSRGFYVADQSVSNYPITYLSLASTLNLRYVDDVLDRLGRDGAAPEPLYRLIRTHEAGRFLKSKGYRYVHFNTNYGGTESSEIADITYSHSHPLLSSEFMRVLIRTTMLRALEPSVADLHRYMFDKVTSVADIEGPTFTLAHFLLPHNPYVFDRDGNVRANVPLGLQWTEKTGGWPERRQYTEQLMFLNKKMRHVIDTILARSRQKPIIIVQADHGSASTFTTDDFASPDSAAFIRERTAILSAFLVPDNVAAALYPTITPVNTFRLLFRRVFDGEFAPLPDRSYIAWYRSPRRLTEVTGRVLGTGAAKPAMALTPRSMPLPRRGTEDDSNAGRPTGG